MTRRLIYIVASITVAMPLVLSCLFFGCIANLNCDPIGEVFLRLLPLVVCISLIIGLSASYFKIHPAYTLFVASFAWIIGLFTSISTLRAPVPFSEYFIGVIVGSLAALTLLFLPRILLWIWKEIKSDLTNT